VPLRFGAIVCAYNEERTLPAGLHSLFAQTRLPDEVIVVNNASTDRTRAVAERIPGVPPATWKIARDSPLSLPAREPDTLCRAIKYLIGPA
jgi:GT2 family glycosyltransferase